MKATVFKAITLLMSVFFIGTTAGAEPVLTFEGTRGPGLGKFIVLLAGDEEYRSEESMPMLARILATRHGFKCAVLFSIDPANGTIAPNCATNQPGLELLDKADLCIVALRFREWPESQMQHFDAFVNSGKPMIGLRTSTHAFAYDRNPSSRYASYDWRSKTWPGGFGKQVLGETWVSHHGEHGKQSTRGKIVQDMKQHPILRGVESFWGPSDVYTAHPPTNSIVLAYGEVLAGMRPDSKPAHGKNDSMMPIIWLRDFQGPSGRTTKVLTSTIGAAVDLQDTGLRRLLVNAAYFLTGLEVPEETDVRTVDVYAPSFFGFDKFKPNVRPNDLR